MEYSETDLCPGCLEAKKGGAHCSLCGYTGDENPEVCLKVGSAVGGNRQARYKVGALTARSGESAVYAAFDRTSGKKVLLREYLPDSLCTRGADGAVSITAGKSALYKTYLSEWEELYETLRGLTSGKGGRSTGRGIEKVTDVFRENGTVYAVCKYGGGVTLRMFLENLPGPIQWEQASEMFPPLLTALSVVHGMKIIHRGISPDTIIVTDKKELRLTDFGIPAGHTAGSAIGSELWAGYTPPEQYSKTGKQGTWSDVYAVSAVMYRVLTGLTPPKSVKEPFGGSTAELDDVKITPAHLVNRNIPRQVSGAVAEGMNPDASERMQTMDSLINRIWSRINSEGVKGLDNGQNKGHKSERELENDNASQNVRYGKGTVLAFAGLAAVVFVLVTLIIVSALNPDMFRSAEKDDYLNTEPRTVYSAPPEIYETVSTASSGGEFSEILAGDAEVPDFVGQKYDSVKEDPKYSMFEFKVAYEQTEDSESGNIIRQNFKAGSFIPQGTPVELTVSGGKGYVTLPDYAGVDVDVYRQMLYALGIKYSVLPVVSTGPVNQVIECRDSTGANIISAGTTININGETVTVCYATPPPVATTTIVTTAGDIDIPAAGGRPAVIDGGSADSADEEEFELFDGN